MGGKKHTVEDARRVITAFGKTAASHPCLWISFCSFWLWPWLLSNTIRRSQPFAQDGSFLAGSYSGLPFFLVLAVALVSIAVWSKTTGRTVSSKTSLTIAGIALPLAAAAVLIFCLSESKVSAFWWIAPVSWPVFGGVGMAFLCLVWGRAFGNAGARMTIFIGIASKLVSAIVTLLVLNAPLALAQASIAVVPLLSVLLLAQDMRRDPALYDEEAPRPSPDAGKVPRCSSVPWKLLVTACVWACVFGAVSRVFYESAAWATLGVPAYLFAALLLAACALWLEIDFNHLLYKMGFVVMACGLLITLVAPQVHSAGYALFNIGYRFIELLIWGLCAHLSFSRKIAPSWIVPINVGVWTFGRFIGFVVASTVLDFSATPSSAANSIVLVCLFALLITSLFLSSRDNLAEGWGIEHVDDDSRSLDLAKLGCERLAVEYGLSPREQEILIAAAQRMTRSDIARDLGISDETVKTHFRNLYRKLNVASKTQLLELVEQAASPLYRRPSLVDGD